VSWFRDKVVDDFLKNGSDYRYGGKKVDAARYVVLKDGSKKPAGRWIRSGSGTVIPPKPKGGGK
jgi:hypothetical protein